jgi:glycosyltransferase involved in cell wall biosynthesis
MLGRNEIIMRIAVLSTPVFPVPPKTYGGVETVVHHLVEGLVRRGHDVTLFTTEGSHTKAHLRVLIKPYGFNTPSPERELIYLDYYSRALKEAERHDIIHNHSGQFPLAFAPFLDVPLVTTYHGLLPKKGPKDPRGVIPNTNSKLPFVSISDDQRKNFPSLNFVATVYNGTVRPELYDFGEGKGGYLVWVGRFAPYKGAHNAISIARALNIPLILGGFIGTEQQYFQQKIAPHIDGKLIRYVGEVNLRQKVALLKDALAFINPIEWKEPFGLVVAESFMCGTPVVATKLGAMPELIDSGKTGWLVSPKRIVSESVERVRDLLALSDGERLAIREACRQVAIDRFTPERMVDGYLKVYEKVIRDYRSRR